MEWPGGRRRIDAAYSSGVIHGVMEALAFALEAVEFFKMMHARQIRNLQVPQCQALLPFCKGCPPFQHVTF